VPGLLTFPQDRVNGIISGQYPSFSVKDGDHFRATVGCQINSKKCNVIFRLDYRVNGKTKNLITWNEIFEGQIYPIDLDLSALAGQTVKFILSVSANGDNNMDNAIWLAPRIIRLGLPTPTPTPVPTNTPKP
jgi:hypothetical protein